MSKRITNLRPKNGAYFELDDEGHLTLRTPLGVIIGDAIESSAVEGCLDFDVVVPEYQVGDLVRCRGASYAHCDDVKGFIVGIDDLKYSFALEGSDRIWSHFKDDGHPHSGWKIVGLWEEGNND